MKGQVLFIFFKKIFMQISIESHYDMVWLNEIYIYIYIVLLFVIIRRHSETNLRIQ